MSFLEKTKTTLKTNQIKLEQKAESEKASKKRSADRQKRVERRLRDAAKRYNGQEGTLKIYTKMQIDALKTLQKTAFKQGSDALNADEKETVADALAALIVHKKYANSAAVNQSNRNTRQRIPSTKDALENEIQAVRSSRGFAEVTKKLKRSHLQNLAASDEAARKFFEEYSAKQKEFTRGRVRTL